MRALEILKGIRIVSFTQFLLGPAGVQYLGDLGADVIKVEPLSGAWERHWSGGEHYLNGWSVFHLLAHRNSRSIAIDLKRSEGQALARKLAAVADVVVQNYRPGVIERLGVGYDEVRKLNPKLIYVSASGYGRGGPYRDLAGQDLLLQALTGLAYITGDGNGPPTAVGCAAVDHHSAALLAMGVLAALVHRLRTGEGQHVEITMVEGALDLQRETVSYHLNGFPVARSHSGLASNYHPAPYGIYRTTDGYIALSVSPLRMLYEATHEERLLPYVAPEEAWCKRDEIHDVVASIIALKSTDAWLDQLRPHGVWVERVNSYTECFDDPGVKHLDPVMEVEVKGAGRVKMLKFPIRFGAGEPAVRHVPPAVGENTAQILKEMGYSDQEIAGLEHDKVITGTT